MRHSPYEGAIDTHTHTQKNSVNWNCFFFFYDDLVDTLPVFGRNGTPLQKETNKFKWTNRKGVVPSYKPFSQKKNNKKNQYIEEQSVEKKGHDEGHDGPSLLEQKTVRIIVKTAHFHVTSTPVFLLCVHNSKGAGVIPHSEKLLRRAPVVRMPVGALPGPQRENARKVFFFFLFLFWNIFQQDQRKNSED